jgi:hypothetical protein
MNIWDEKARAVSRVARIVAYDVSATFGDGLPGRIEQRVVDDVGKFHLDAAAWEAGDVAYQCLKQLYPNGINAVEFSIVANEFYVLACNELYPKILSMAEAGQVEIKLFGVDGLKKAWANYDWCERVMLAYDFIDEVIATGADFKNPLSTALPLILLQRLDDAVIAEVLDGRGLPETIFEIAGLKDRLQIQRHVEIKLLAVQNSAKRKASSRGKFAADALHSKPGGSHEKKAAILALWATGKYQSRDVCAEEECAAIGLSYSKTRKHLIGTPDNPKPS